jgi:hypothetical protein
MSLLYGTDEFFLRHSALWTLDIAREKSKILRIRHFEWPDMEWKEWLEADPACRGWIARFVTSPRKSPFLSWCKQ